jgi:hypothetical protein
MGFLGPEGILSNTLKKMQTSHGIWAVARSKIHNVQIVSSLDFPAMTGARLV